MTSKERSAIEDGAGNVRFCGEFLYAFDAWNRLVAVWKARRADNATALPSASSPWAGVEVGNWLKRFRYDALGRLIEVQSPMAGPEWPDAVLERVERFWYDGSRRIQEVTQDPIDLLYVVNKYGTEGLVEYITTGLIGALQGAPTGFPYRVLNREYIWGVGMGGGAGGVDELHVFFDRDRRPWGVLQDSDGDNVAVVDDGGAVVAEFVYDPYGAVIGQRSYGIHPPLKSGHRGLFAESLTVGTVGAPDVDLGDPESTVVAWVDGRVLVPNERVVYHMRNRAYDPGPSGATAGRFLQRDPNASGAVLYGGGGGLGSHGAAPVAMVTGLDLAAHIADGVNTYGYLRGSPRGAGDPSGLWREQAANNALEIAGLLSPLPGPGDFLRGVLSAVVSEYSANLSWDVDWAMDWSAGDDWHSRGDNAWVTLAIGRGLYDSFDIDIPFSEDTVNPIDLVAHSGNTRSPYKSIKTKFGRAKYSKTITINGMTAYKYVNPKGGRQLIKFDENAIQARRHVIPSNHAQEVRDANMSYWGKPYNPPDMDWHHHWKVGEMQLVPRLLHQAIGAGHAGRAFGW